MPWAYEKGHHMATYSSASIKKCHNGLKGLSTYDPEQTRVMQEGQTEWQNPNIAKECAHRIDLVSNRVVDEDREGAVHDAVLARIKEAQGDKTLRKNGVFCLQFYANMPDYSHRSAAERKRFEELVRAFLGTLYGDENIVDMRWHFDESAPHIHATIVPITADGRLCCKEVFRPTKKRQEKWQRDYYEAVAKPMGYDAPDFGHANEKGYTKSTAANRKQAKAMEERRDAAVKAAAEAQERQAIAEGLATEQLDAFVKASSKAAEAERERDALRGEVAALHGERRQAVEATKAARAAQGEAEQAAHSAREAADRAAADLAETKAAADAETERLESVRRAGKAADARVAELRERVAAARAAADECSSQPARPSVAEDARTLFGGRNLKAEEEQLRSECDALEQRQSALRDEVRGLGIRIRELVSNIETLKDRVIAKCREGIRVDRMPRNLANMLFNLLDRKRIEGRMRAGGEWASVATGVYAADTSKRQQACAEAPRWGLRRERGRSR